MDHSKKWGSGTSSTTFIEKDLARLHFGCVQETQEKQQVKDQQS